MKLFKANFIFVSTEATKEDVSISLTLNDTKAKLTIRSDHLDQETQFDSSILNQNKEILKRRPKLKEECEDEGTVSYNKENNTIRAKYCNKSDIDILKIHSIITGVLSNNNDELGWIKKREELLIELDQPLSIIRRKTLRKAYEKIESKINQNKNKKTEYLTLTTDLLEEYKSSTSNRKLSIVSKYLEVTKIYVNYDLYVQHKDRNICIGCGYSFSECVWYRQGIVCPKCSVVNVSHNRMLDTEKIPTQNIKGNKRKELTFMTRLNEFFCTKDIDIPNDLKEKLNEYFEHKYPTLMPKKIKTLPLVRDGDTKYKRGDTSISIMTEALEKCNFSKMYAHVRYICKIYWNWRVCDFSHKKNDIIIRYRITSAIYDQIKEGSSNLKADFHLFKILQTIGLVCTLEDFKPIKGDQTLTSYENYWLRIEKKILKNKEYQYHHNELIDWNIDISRVLSLKGIKYKHDPYFNGNIYDEYRYHIKTQGK